MLRKTAITNPTKKTETKKPPKNKKKTESSKDFEKKWDGNLRNMESKCRDLLLEEHCKKLFYLINCFWEAIVDVDVDISWLVKVRNHLDKIEKEHSKTKRKK